MLKLIVVGLSFVVVSGVPLDLTPLKTSNVSYTELIRPSPINPDIPMDPKPPERIIFDDNQPERDRKPLPSEEHGTLENVNGELRASSNDKTPKEIDDISNFEDKKENSETDKSVAPIIMYAAKVGDDFQTSHRIPNTYEGDSKFETSHHIPTHIENERAKQIENAKIAQE